MYPVIPMESMVSAIEFLCCLFTALAAICGCLMGRA